MNDHESLIELPDLPINKHQARIKDAISKSRVVVLTGETGSGKSTQVPRMCLELLAERGRQEKKNGNPKNYVVYCTQPRRIAATSLAHRVADEVRTMAHRDATYGTKLTAMFTEQEWSKSKRTKRPNSLKKGPKQKKNSVLSEYSVGGIVGYHVRFERMTSHCSSVRFVTDGVLMRSMMESQYIPEASIIIVDEAHERSLKSDILLGRLFGLLELRKDIKVVVMSATLELDLFMNHFKQFKPVHVGVEGRTYPVQKFFIAENTDDYLKATSSAVLQMHQNYGPGSVLCFLPGKEEINQVKKDLEEMDRKIEPLIRLLDKPSLINPGQGIVEVSPYGKPLPDDLLEQSYRAMMNNGDEVPDCEEPVAGGPLRSFSLHHKKEKKLDRLEILSLHASQPIEEQAKVFQPPTPGYRRIILATNIAETSITVPDVRFVVDTGKQKTKHYYPELGLESLELTNCSKAQMNQRSGRAGRVSPGLAIRLCDELAFDQLLDQQDPEVVRNELTQEILELLKSGINIDTFKWLQPPPDSLKYSALGQLFWLGAVDKEAKITEVGRQLTMFPTHPVMAKILMESIEFGCVEEALSFIGMIEADFQMPTSSYVDGQPSSENRGRLKGREMKVFWRKLLCPDSDAMTYVNLYNCYNAAENKRAFVNMFGGDIRTFQKADRIRDQLREVVVGQLKSRVTTIRPSSTHYANLNSSKYCQDDDGAEEAKEQDSDSGDIDLEIEEKKQWWDPLRKCLAKVLFMRMAKIEDCGEVEGEVTKKASYNTMFTNQTAKVHPSSGLSMGITGVRSFGSGDQDLHGVGLSSDQRKTKDKSSALEEYHFHPPFLVFTNLLVTTQSYLHGVTAIDARWMLEFGRPEFVVRSDTNEDK